MSDITIQIDDAIRQETETLFEKLGISMSSAIIGFLRYAIHLQDMPFPISEKSREETYNGYFTPQGWRERKGVGP